MHLLFDRTPDYTAPYPVGDPADLEPDIGDIGNGKIDATAFFSGRGGSRLLDADSLVEIDQFYIDEASDPAFAVGFGDVDVHEVGNRPRADTDRPDTIGVEAVRGHGKHPPPFIRDSNLLERLNKKIRRRTDFANIFPDCPSIVRLVGALPAEQHHEWAIARAA